MPRPGPLFVLDGTALVFRAYYAFQHTGLRTQRGVDTRTTFGVVNLVLSLLERHRPQHLVVVFDSKLSTASFRRRMVTEARTAGHRRWDSAQTFWDFAYPSPATRRRACRPSANGHDLTVATGLKYMVQGGEATAAVAAVVQEIVTGSLEDTAALEAGLQAFPNYKGHRASQPNDLYEGLQSAIDLFDTIGLPVLLTPAGWEADDVLASITAGVRTTGMPVCIVSNDKDFYQLLADDVVTILPPTAGVVPLAPGFVGHIHTTNVYVYTSTKVEEKQRVPSFNESCH